jgi:hypothetical protein
MARVCAVVGAGSVEDCLGDGETGRERGRMDMRGRWTSRCTLMLGRNSDIDGDGYVKRERQSDVEA